MWHVIAEPAQCRGRIGPYPEPGERDRRRRCKQILWVGAWFYLHDGKPYCEACATSEKQDINAEPRRPALRGDKLVSRVQA